MTKVLGASVLIWVLIAGCGSADGETPGDQPTGTSTTQEDDGGGGY